MAIPLIGVPSLGGEIVMVVVIIIIGVIGAVIANRL